MDTAAELTLDELVAALEELDACWAARSWVREFATPRAAYEQAPVNYLLWLAGNLPALPALAPLTTPWAADIAERAERYLINAPFVPFDLDVPPYEVVNDIGRRHLPFELLSAALVRYMRSVADGHR